MGAYRCARSLAHTFDRLTTTTGHVACWTHWALTEPRSRPLNPPLPRDPTTKRSAPSDHSTRPSAGTSDSIGTGIGLTVDSPVVNSAISLSRTSRDRSRNQASSVGHSLFHPSDIGR